MNDKIVFYDYANLGDVCAGPMDTMIEHWDRADILETSNYPEDAESFFQDFNRIDSKKLLEYPSMVGYNTIYSHHFAFNSECYLDYVYRRMRGLSNYRLPTTALAAVPYKDDGDYICLHVLHLTNVPGQELCTGIKEICEKYSKAPYVLGDCDDRRR